MKGEKERGNECLLVMAPCLTSGFCSREILTGCDELSSRFTSFTLRSLLNVSFMICPFDERHVYINIYYLPLPFRTSSSTFIPSSFSIVCKQAILTRQRFF